MNTLSELFQSIEDDDRWFYLSPSKESDLSKVEAKLNREIPVSVRELYSYLGGGEWAGKRLVQIFDLPALEDVNLELPKWLAGTFAFAADGGSLWYIVDVENVLGKGNNTVWSLPAGALLTSEARFIAVDMVGFVRWMIQKE